MNTRKNGLSHEWFPYRFQICIIYVLACVLMAGGLSQAQAYVCGDNDGDGKIDIGDVVVLIDYIFRGGPLPTQTEGSDANCNGGIDIGDAVFLIRYIFGKGPAPCSECPPIDQYILFEICYSNFAWMPTLKGLYVTNTGQVITYQYDPDDVFWPPPLWDDDITEWELLYRYRHNPRLCRTVPPDELYAMYQLIDPAGEGSLSATVMRCADFGTMYFVAYTFDAQSSTYHPILLEIAGDWAQTNFSPEAGILFEWLRMCGYENIPCRY